MSRSSRVALCYLFSVFTGLSFTLHSPSIGIAGDLSITPFLNGERVELIGEGSLNNWGGGFNPGSTSGITQQSSVVRSGEGAYKVDLGSVPIGSAKFFQTFSSSTGATSSHRQTRNIEYFESFQGYVRNDTGIPFTLKIELKDYRDSLSHQANRSYSIPAGGDWTKIDMPLNFSTGNGWNIVGAPDFERTFSVGYIVEANLATVTGDIFLDDFELIESGGPVDIQTAPLATLVEQIAHRQFDGLWSARSRTHGLIPNTSHQSSLSAMNTTAGVLWSLPKAVQRGWVSQGTADAYVSQVAGTLDTILNQTTYLPSRFVDLATGNPGANAEESSIDAAFVAMALHNYKSLPGTSQLLHDTIDTVQNRFNFSAFDNGSGFRLAYFPVTGFTPGTYNGYTNEGKAISVAAELSDDHHVPLEDRWNADTLRIRSSLVNPDDVHLVHTSSAFRAPFVQALLNLFVDTSDRGVDNFPNRSLAGNPWQNYIRYEKEVAAKLVQLGRDSLFQPDAGQGGPPQGYQPYSLYNDYGESDLFMPWSVALALLADAEGSEAALRTLLDADLHGPLGLADSARWSTGGIEPFDVPAYQDNWNTALSTIAFLDLLDRFEGVESSSDLFSALPELSAALDKVFIDGDLDGNGTTNSADLMIWESGYGTIGATPADGDADGNNIVDGLDFLRWQRGIGSSVSASSYATQVPEPSFVCLVCEVLCLGSWPRRRRS